MMGVGRERRLSIVIPVYNRANIVCRTLDSIASQQRIEECKIIIVDNASSDDTYAVLQQWTDSHAAARLDVDVVSEIKPGACAARNYGLSLVNTDYVMFFDSDDIMNPGLVSAVIDAVTDNPGIDVVGWNIMIQLKGDRWRKGRFETKNVLWNHIIHATLSTQRYAVKTQLVRFVGGWNESLGCWNDLELGLRILLARPSIIALPSDAWVTTFFTPQSITGIRLSDNSSGREASLDVCESNLERAGYACGWINVRRVILAADYSREKCTHLAKALMKRTMRDKSLKDKIILKALFVKHKIYPRGTARFAALFYSKKIVNL